MWSTEVTPMLELTTAVMCKKRETQKRHRAMSDVLELDWLCRLCEPNTCAMSDLPKKKHLDPALKLITSSEI